MSLASAPAVPMSSPRQPGDWVARFDVGGLPVLPETASVIEVLRAQEDAVDAHTLAQSIDSDPLMALKLLSHVGTLRQGREGGEPETVTAALVMLGVPPFFHAFGPQESVEDRLAGCPGAPEGFHAVVQRGRRAANFGVAFALQRLDRDAAVIHLAALLHDFAELLLWLDEPRLALEMSRRQCSDPRLRSDDVQRALLHTTLPELQHVLMQRWHLPRLLVEMNDDSLHRDSAQARTVLLAVRLARHTAQGWENPALPDDIRDIAELLHLGSDPTLHLLREIDA